MNFTVKSLYLCVRDMERAIQDREGNHIELTAPYQKE